MANDKRKREWKKKSKDHFNLTPVDLTSLKHFLHLWVKDFKSTFSFVHHFR